jgi:adenylate kinase
MASIRRRKHKIFLIFLGPPGSGKDTQAEKIAAAAGLPLFNPGELFRREVKAGTVLGKKIAPVIARGGLIGDTIVGKLVEEFLGKKEARAGAIFDGFPRTVAQTRFLQEKLERMTDGAHEIYAILIAVGDREVKRRLANRRICKCGETFHLIFKPPKEKGKCDRCGKHLIMRDDDRPEVIAGRLALYRRHIGPVLGFFKEKHELLSINGEKNIEEVGGAIKKLLKKRKII